MKLKATIAAAGESNRGGRPRTGGLFQRNGLWYARFTANKDGESVRVVRCLDTDSKQVARAKLARLIQEEIRPEEAANCETFEQAARRVNDAHRELGAKNWKRELARLEHHVFCVIGHMPVAAVRARHINELLEGVKLTGIRRKAQHKAPSRSTLKHILNCISVVLDDLWRKEVLAENSALRARIPKTQTDVRERAVLTDFELARYLAFHYEDQRAQVGLLQRQTMACISRLFGGVRTGDLHSMTWDSFDTPNGRFAWGYAPRSKTRKPQRLIVDDMLRPIIRRWWEFSSCPTEGFLFPALRDGKHSKAGKGEKHQVSHACAMRQDLRRAFGIDKLEPTVINRKNGRRLTVYKWVESRKMTARERELLVGNTHTLPVDFHSWRRAYCQALADAGVNAQLAQALAGHATESAHERYLRNSEKARALPEQARPQIDLSKVQQSPARVLATSRSKTS